MMGQVSSIKCFALSYQWYISWRHSSYYYSFYYHFDSSSVAGLIFFWSLRWASISEALLCYCCCCWFWETRESSKMLLDGPRKRAFWVPLSRSIYSFLFLLNYDEQRWSIWLEKDSYSIYRACSVGKVELERKVIVEVASSSILTTRFPRADRWSPRCFVASS